MVIRPQVPLNPTTVLSIRICYQPQQISMSLLCTERVLTVNVQMIKNILNQGEGVNFGSYRCNYVRADLKLPTDENHVCGHLHVVLKDL